MDDTSFWPHLFALTERRRPSFIAGAALVWWQAKVLFLPEDIVHAPYDQQDEIIQTAIANHLSRYVFGCLFGAVTGYLYRPVPNVAILYSPSGQVVEKDVAADQVEIAEVHIGRHAIMMR